MEQANLIVPPNDNAKDLLLACERARFRNHDWPTTIVAPKHVRSYKGGRWLAFPVEAEVLFGTGWDGDSDQVDDFWRWANEVMLPIGRGESVSEANEKMKLLLRTSANRLAYMTRVGGEKPGWTFEEMKGDEKPDVGRQEATDVADQYLKNMWLEGFKIDGKRGFTVIPVLEFLNGLPWNNMALNFIIALRPSAVRVVQHTEPTQANSVGWRVTVYLGPNNRNIHYIEQEVDVGLIGCRYGADVTVGGMWFGRNRTVL